MSVRFVIGRAGSGKTAHCLEQITSRLRESPVQGQALFLLVPEQASMQMERALLENTRVAGFVRCEVLSFRRLAHRVLNACGAGVRTISATGRLMVLRCLVAQHSGSLTTFSSSRGRRGLIERLGRTIDELVREEVSPEAIAEAIDRIGPDDEPLAMRLRDIHLIYQAYLSRLGTELTDPGHHLAMVRERLDAYQPLRNSLIWVDGFAGLTKQEHNLLVSLAGLAERMEISLLMDPDSEVLTRGVPVEPFNLFARTERTYLSLCRAMRAAGLPLEGPLVFRGRSPRFSDSPGLAKLEQGLFVTPARGPAGRRNAADAGQGLQLVQAATRRLEIAAAVAEIQRLVRRCDPPMRYRDIAVIVRNLEPYHDLLSAALSAAGIPHFIDRRRPVAHHALVQFVRSAVELLRYVDVESVSTFIKTGLTAVADEDADLLENYLRAHGIAGRHNWVHGEWSYRGRPSRLAPEERCGDVGARDLDLINETRKRLVRLLGPWWTLADGSGLAPGTQWAAGLLDLLQRFQIPRRITEWADRADRAGRVEEAQEHRQVWSHVVDLLEDLDGVFGSELMTPEDLAEVVDTALAGTTLGLTPPTLDQVLVSSIERSRHPPIRAAFVLGFGEGLFPIRPEEDPIFSDRHRREMAGLGIELAPTSRQQLFDERMLAYIALTRPSERLWVSWPAAEDDGSVLRPSPYVQMIRAVFPGLLVTELADPMASRRMWAISSAGDAAAAIVADLRLRGRRAAPGPPAAEDHRRWNALYEWARNSDPVREPLSRAVASLTYSNSAMLSAEAVKRVYGETLRSSVSRLERFAACPFQHFAADVLGLEPPLEWKLDPPDLGLIYHRVLESYVSSLIDAKRGLADTDPNDLAKTIQMLSQQTSTEMLDETIVQDERNAYILQRGTEDLIQAMRAQRFTAASGAYRPAGVEVCFGLETAEPPRPGQAFLPPLQITTPAGKTVLLRGKIDRVDLARLGERTLAAVVDYKWSPPRQLRLDRAYYGLDLQLLTYLAVLAEHGRRIANQPVEPAGAFFATLLDQVQRLDAPPQEPPEEADRYRPLRPRGVFDLEGLRAFDSDFGPGSSSKVIAARLNKDGSPGLLNQTDAAGHEAFLALLDHIRRKIGELCDRMLNGEVAVRPYRMGQTTPCTWCPYGSVCRIELVWFSANVLHRMKRLEVFNLLCPGSGEASDGE